MALPLGALPLGALALGLWRGEAPTPVQWHGEVLGAVSSLTLWHANPRVAERAIARMRVEIDRLENIFSLYRPQSEITRLNADGLLAAPSGDFVQLLEASRRIAEVSGGAFDPTIQPLWRLHSAAGAGLVPPPAAVDRALALVDYRNLSAGTAGIRFGRPGMAISLNGIAQGYITDRITEILGNEGFENAMVELGEMRALGAAPDGQPFVVALVDPLAPASVGRSVRLADRSLAVSGGYGTVFADGRHHIFDPHTGDSPRQLVQVAVLADRATAADALSTAIYVAGEAGAAPLLAAYPGASAILSRPDGSTLEV
jgi:thiamine biosynthesis lipoprotein